MWCFFFFKSIEMIVIFLPAWGMLLSEAFSCFPLSAFWSCVVVQHLVVSEARVLLCAVELFRPRPCSAAKWSVICGWEKVATVQSMREAHLKLSVDRNSCALYIGKLKNLHVVQI